MSNIPKIIHYCWVGGNPKPPSVLYCIESWRKFCPEYEIQEWNETNYDFTKNEYMKQAYEAEKWGFVPDYARLDIVYEHGGVYLDTDVELLHSFDDLLENDCFFGFEDTGDGEFFVNCGHGFGAKPHHNIIKEARDLYDELSFYKEDGSLNLLASPYFTTQSLRQFGLRQVNKDQHLNGAIVFASDVLCPKNFRTGVLKKTARTVSIHHFTASWVDERIKEEMRHQQKINRLLGKHVGKYYLILESVIQKYTLKEMFLKLPVRIARKFKRKLIETKDAIPYYEKLLAATFAKIGDDIPVILDTGIDSDNCGDLVIMEQCMCELENVVDVNKMSHIPTHRFPTEEESRLLKSAAKKILCGTNILSGQMRHYGLWKLDADIAKYKNTLLMGVGFESNNQSFDWYSKRMFHTILCKEGIHSVRDSFSEKKLRNMGVKNVLNTGCPTMWSLTPAHCAKIPTTKAKNVICTVTDYDKDTRSDKAMIDILLNTYDNVYFWPQGEHDKEYVDSLGYKEKVILLPGTLEAYDDILNKVDLDYVGTRLHAGIRALSKGHRSLVIAIDNRALCISEDTGLPIIKRDDVKWSLKEVLAGEIQSSISLPWHNIELWKSQFRSGR